MRAVGSWDSKGGFTRLQGIVLRGFRFFFNGAGFGFRFRAYWLQHIRFIPKGTCWDY